jgi:ubiquitin-activating enzyme E1
MNMEKAIKQEDGISEQDINVRIDEINTQNDMEDRYSRQSYSIGRDSTMKLSKSRILVIGSDILGEEIIKNAILMGIGEIDICFQTNLHETENLYFEKNSLHELRILNPNVKINLVEIKNKFGMMKNEIFDNYSMTILVNASTSEAIIINKITRICGKQLIVTGTNGLFGYIFNDFGSEFEIIDQDGENYEELMLDEIIDSVVSFKSKHKLNNGDLLNITYSNNFEEERKVLSITSPFSIKIDGDISPDISHYTFIKKKKIIIKNENITFEEFIANKRHDKMITGDFSIPFDRNELLFDLNLTLNNYFMKFGEMPRSWIHNDYNIFMNIMMEVLNIKEEDFNDENTNDDKIKLIKNNSNFIKKFCFTSRGSFKPLSSVIGGIVSHEVIKGITKKFLPINQSLYIDLLNDLITDDEVNNIDINDYQGAYDNKYNGLINIFGQTFVEKLQNTHPFVIGSGAIGCEILKNLCCLGIKNISLTDNDNIEKSNLSRQLLFDDNDIGRSKSIAAGSKIMSKNSDIRVNIYEERVESKTENVFDNYFHENVDIYLNALDNVHARKYMDDMAIKYEKPLIDSGTTGAQGSTGVIIPYLTESYNSQKNDADEEQIPLCTLKSFPFKYEHTIQWSRELFEEEFKIIPGIIKKYCANNYEKVHTESGGVLTKIYRILYKLKSFNYSYESYIIQAKLLFHDNFVENIKKTIEEYKDKKGYSGKMPKFIEDSDTEKEFINQTIIIYNQVYKTNFVYNGENIPVNYDDFDSTKIKDINYIEHEDLVTLFINLLSVFKNKHINEVEFEKDDESLCHIDWIASSSNIRNYQYSIKQTDKYEIKIIAGKIIPAMITTTSVTSGYQIIEFIKIAKLYEYGKYHSDEHRKDIELYRNKYINLNFNYHIGNEPTEHKKYKLEQQVDDSSESGSMEEIQTTNNINLWTRFVCDSNKTNDIVKLISLETNNCLTVYSIYETCENKECIYDNYEKIKNETKSSHCVVEFDEYEAEKFVVIVTPNLSINNECKAFDTKEYEKSCSFL